MNTRTRIISLLGCSMVVLFLLTTGSLEASLIAVVADPPDGGKVATSDDGDSDRGPLAGPRGPRREAPPPEADDDEAQDEPRKMRPARQRGEFGGGDQDRRRPRRGPRGERFGGDGPPRRGPGPGRDFPHPRFELTPEVVERVMEFLEEKLPDWHERLDQLRDENPQAFRGALRRVIPLVEEYRRLQETNPDLAKKVIEEFGIEHQLRKLARQYLEAEGDLEAQEKIETQIAPLVRKQLEIRLLRQEAKLDEMQKRLDRGREKLEEDRAKLDKSVAKRIKQIKKGKFRERGHDKFRRDRKRGRPGYRDGPRHGKSHGEDDGRDRPRRRKPPREREDEL